VSEPDEGEPRVTLDARVMMTHRTAMTIVLAMAACVLIYVGIGLLNLRGGTLHGSSSNLRVPLYGAAAVFAMCSILLRRVLLLRFRLESIAQRRGAVGVIRHLFRVTLMSAAMAEAVGVIALLITFFGGDEADLIQLGIVALVASLYNYPRLGTWRQAVDYFTTAAPKAG